MQLSDELKTLLTNPELWDAVRAEIDAEVHAWIAHQAYANVGTIGKRHDNLSPSAKVVASIKGIK